MTLYNNYKEKIDDIDDRFKILLNRYKNSYPLYKANQENTEYKNSYMNDYKLIKDIFNELMNLEIDIDKSLKTQNEQIEELDKNISYNQKLYNKYKDENDNIIDSNQASIPREKELTHELNRYKIKIIINMIISITSLYIFYRIYKL